jgi:hypothetical protein
VGTRVVLDVSEKRYSGRFGEEMFWTFRRREFFFSERDLQKSELYDMISMLTTIWLTPGGSSRVHINTQTVHRRTQLSTRTTQLTTKQSI